MTHVPVPLQSCATTLVPEQELAPQVVPFGAKAHDPGPLVEPVHAASWPHALVMSLMQSPFGFDPLFAGPQVPLCVPDCLFIAAHASHVFEHAVLQHTPSAQLVVTHWLLAVQPKPWAILGMQIPPEQ
jgi:hypothetical protein